MRLRRGSRGVAGADFLQDAAAGGLWARKVVVAERAVGDHGDTVLLTPRQHSVFDRALAQVVENLVTDETPIAGGSRRTLPGRASSEVADAWTRANLPIAAQRITEGQRWCPPTSRYSPRASATGSSPNGRSEGGQVDPWQAAMVPRREGMLRKNLGDQEDLVTPPGNCLGDDLLGGPRAVHLRGVDVSHAEVKAPAQGGDRRHGGGAFVVPGALTDHGHVAPSGAEPTLFHVSPPYHASLARGESGLSCVASRHPPLPPLHDGQIGHAEELGIVRPHEFRLEAARPGQAARQVREGCTCTEFSV